jgi:hypothetical protein
MFFGISRSDSAIRTLGSLASNSESALANKFLIRTKEGRTEISSQYSPLSQYNEVLHYDCRNNFNLQTALSCWQIPVITAGETATSKLFCNSRPRVSKKSSRKSIRKRLYRPGCFELCKAQPRSPENIRIKQLSSKVIRMWRPRRGCFLDDSVITNRPSLT